MVSLSLLMFFITSAKVVNYFELSKKNRIFGAIFSSVECIVYGVEAGKLSQGNPRALNQWWELSMCTNERGVRNY